MITFADLTEPAAAGAERGVDRQLWLACAGGMCTVPPVGASVYYFPQGHAEHALGLAGAADLSAARVPALVPCRVAAVRYMADQDTDEVFARIRLVPLRGGGEAGDASLENDAAAGDEQEKPASFAKTLTQSDANNGGGFSVPRYCAETIFPRLDYAADPPVQTVVAKDVHGAAWKFRHIYRGTPRRHLLTTGWSTFVNQKKLVAGDSIVFLRGDGGDLHIGIRRAKRGFCGAGGGGDGGEEAPMPGWDHYAGMNMMRGNVSPCEAAKARGKVRPEDVAEAARLASGGQPCEVVYYPRASTPEFCVRAAAVRVAMRVQWSPGMRFKMAFETEDSSRISWFMGTVAGVQVADPIRWPQSPWRLLQVTWDEPDLLQNVKRVSPWLVELVSSIPAIHLASFSPPRKKPRIPAYPEFPFEGQLLNPAFPPNPLPHGHNGHHFLHHTHPSFFPFPDGSAPAAIQGARHAQFVPPLSDLHLTHLQSSLLHPGLRRPDHVGPTTPLPARISTDLTIGGAPARDDVSCALSIGADKKPDAAKPAGLVLFGRTILTQQQMSLSGSGGATSPAATGNSSPNWNAADKGPNASEGSGSGSGSGVTQNSPTKNAPSSERVPWFMDGSQSQAPELVGLEPGQCKVFVESDTVGRNLDLSALGSFEELYGRLSEMFCMESAELRSRVLYRGGAGDVKHAGDEPFSVFVKSARRLTILTDAGSDNLGSC
ncbi:Auxin response factor 8 [Dichanthelium oligosanthes]|uniref:Auxin response factor n=1 Tax=Dichanthelium oligosanthes TaxID=888268 RepID=A0A1E5VXR0_9POAL|nr:Auxin response factor 8 [Dichanthelium oligosanthes]